ncbi:MAG: CRISPR-associated endonuclease Cas6, partial [Methanoregula sp.]|nr:CRISPR-associated endonuclease Cas6 [Methanoregula sp.]
MFLKIFTLTLEPVDPIQFSIAELRSHLAGKLAEYTALHKDNSSGFIHRYPAVQCKQIKNTLLVFGISQGAALLEQLSKNQKEISAGKNTCTILERDPAIRNEEFGISGTPVIYEFLTPWLALNQQNAKKFYELKGKAERDAFIHKILDDNLAILCKSLDYKTPGPVTCEAKIKFRIDWIDRESVMVFLGKLRTNLRIPDYFAIGQSVSQGFG